MATNSFNNHIFSVIYSTLTKTFATIFLNRGISLCAGSCLPFILLQLIKFWHRRRYVIPLNNCYLAMFETESE